MAHRPGFTTALTGRFITALILCVLTHSAAARDLEPAKPEREGFDAVRLQRIAEQMNARVADGTMVGGMGMIARHDKIVYVDTWGMRDREAGKPMTADTIFRIYSMSKPITSVAVMMLYEEGKFFLNDPVARYIPELANLEVAVSTADGGTRAESDGTQSRTIGTGDETKAGLTRKPGRQPTIRDLLRHTAGFTYGVFGNTEVDQQYRQAQMLVDHPSLEDFVTKLGQIPLQYEPGSRWHYSVSVDVLGRLVEVTSGMKLGDFLEERIFRPLGMKDTAFTVPAEKADRFAQLYSPKGTGEGTDVFLSQPTSRELVVARDFANRNFQPGATFQSGGGGLVSTAMDYLRFCQMLLNGGALDGVRLLSPMTIALMTTDQLGDVPAGFSRHGATFGLGFAVTEDQGEIGELGSVGEYNWGGAAGTRFWIDPKQDLIGIFMVQSLPHRTRLAEEFKILTYQAIVE
jgi:CubicO group peptidase (beta-lactamase class C family)